MAFSPFRLNIRQKVVVGFISVIFVIGWIAALSYYYLHVIELKQRIVQEADDLRDLILEMRRYEKNFLLYGSMEDVKENQRYHDLAGEALAKVMGEGLTLKIAPQLNLLKGELSAYRKIIDQIEVQPRPAERGQQRFLIPPDAEEHLRESGKKLVALSQQLVVFERQRILDIILRLKTQLAASIVVFLLLGVFLTVLVSRKIIQPLGVIEKTTYRIAQGDFRPLPVWGTKDETQQVVEAFNRMVAELERRQDQLVQSKKMSSLGILTAGIAHQLNNPLNNISTSCQIVLEELGHGDQALLTKMLVNIEHEVQRARDIVKGLLEFSRVRDFALQQVPLKDVVQRSVKLISSQIPPGVDVVENIPEDLSLFIDPHRMQEVFLNLLMNAIQAVKEPPGEIRIAARADQEHRQAVITVEDNGVGIPEEELERIFDPFFTTKEVGMGTGLGLSIAYGVIEKHRGSIRAESTVGEGTRFIITLPLFPAANDGRHGA